MNTKSPFRDLPYTGATYVANEAAKLGFRNAHPDWCNLGQGQPEIGPLAGAPDRMTELAIRQEDLAYGAASGSDALREAIARHYNRLYRRDKRSQYGKENVCIAAGGRPALSRLLGALGGCRLGYLVPDYMAFEDLIDLNSQRLEAVPVHADAENGFHLSAQDLESSIRENALDALLFSNPCNPTGNLVRDAELDAYAGIARSTGCWLLADEFYSHFIFKPDGSPDEGPVSAAAHIGNVEDDPVVIVDGLTKNYRCPGLRLGWVVGPQKVIEKVSRVGIAIDGGPSNIVQHAAVDILQADKADSETRALRHVFAEKRRVMMKALLEMGIEIPSPGLGTFYVWGDVRNLPAPLNDDEGFFREGLKHKVVTVPGRFFYIDPGRKRTEPGMGGSWVRFSFGPPLENLQSGLGRLADMVKLHHKSTSFI